MNERIALVFSEVLQVPVEAIHDTSSPETIARWDSLGAINLVSALEEEFGVRLNSREIVSMRSVADVRTVLRAKGIGDA